MVKHISDFSGKEIKGSLIAAKDPYVLYERIDPKDNKHIFYNLFKKLDNGLYRAICGDSDKTSMLNVINKSDQV